MDLRLITLLDEQELTKTLAFPEDCLSFVCDPEIFAQLVELDGYAKLHIRATDIPPQLWITLDENGTSKIREDGYGEPLQFVYAKDLAKLKLGDDASPKNKAILAFVKELPFTTPIILYWH